MPTLTTVTADRLPPLAAMLARAFADDPMVAWPFHYHDVEGRAEPLFAAVLGAYQPYGVVLEADEGAGVAVWLGPDSGVDLEVMNDITTTTVAGLTDDGGARYGAFWGWLESFVPAEPHWMLEIVAVDPTLQRGGIGSALVRHGIRQAAADGLPIFLETGRYSNVTYYERFGFHVVDERDAPGQGPRVWFMRLDPDRTRR